MVECQEPRCVRQATKEWEGRKVCYDHFEFYEEQIEKARREGYGPIALT